MTTRPLGTYCVLAIALALFPVGAQATKFKVLYSFAGGSDDGEYPQASLLRDKMGNLYGTTYAGGDNDFGTVFRIAPNGAETLLYSFDATNGAYPTDNLVADASGNLYGTTTEGGAKNSGTIFKLAPDGTLSLLYSFRGGKDGGSPYAGLLRKKDTLYGTAQSGGASGREVVFQLASNGTETVIHSFAGGKDGAGPYAGLNSDKAGNFYGTTYLDGANNKGTVYKVTRDGRATVIHAFAGGSDGASPFGALVADRKGNLYGTTQQGGTSDAGTVFKIAPDGTESVLYSFTGGSDGADPSCTLVLDATGNLYGTTTLSEDDGAGTVFKLTTGGAIKVLHSFTGAGGAQPSAGLIADESGNFYGTTPLSGNLGYGVVFQIRE